MKSGHGNTVRRFQRETCSTYRCTSTVLGNNCFPIEPYSLSLVQALLLIIAASTKVNKDARTPHVLYRKADGFGY